MAEPKHVIGIAGSLRRGSYNKSLLRAAIELSPESLRIETASLDDIPLYNGDVEARGFPAAVSALKDRIAAADGLFVVTPEYNNSVPGVLKNAIDWLSRPASDIKRVFGGKPVAIVGASEGRFGTVLSQAAWLPVFRSLNARVWFGPKLAVGQSAKVFDEQGKLIDERVRGELTKLVNGFAEELAR